MKHQKINIIFFDVFASLFWWIMSRGTRTRTKALLLWLKPFKFVHEFHKIVFFLIFVFRFCLKKMEFPRTQNYACLLCFILTTVLYDKHIFQINNIHLVNIFRSATNKKKIRKYHKSVQISFLARVKPRNFFAQRFFHVNGNKVRRPA